MGMTSDTMGMRAAPRRGIQGQPGGGIRTALGHGGAMVGRGEQAAAGIQDGRDIINPVLMVVNWNDDGKLSLFSAIGCIYIWVRWHLRI